MTEALEADASVPTEARPAPKPPAVRRRAMPDSIFDAPIRDAKWRISEHGLRLITTFEAGPHLVAYKCDGGRWTLSHGVTFYPNGSRVREGDTITFAQHIKMFRYALSVFEEAVAARCKVEPTQYQFDAMVALCYNIGLDQFSGSSVERRHNDKRFEDAAEAFTYWKFTTTTREGAVYKQALEGIYRRHAAEGCLYLGFEFEAAAAYGKVKLEAEPGWDGDRWLDQITFATPWSEIRQTAARSPLPAPVHDAVSPALKPLVTPPSPPPLPSSPPPPPKPKKPFLKGKRTYIGGALLAFLATPEVAAVAEEMMQRFGTEGSVVYRALWAGGLLLVVIGRMQAVKPAPAPPPIVVSQGGGQ